MSLISCEINLTITWSSTCFITNSTGLRRFTVTDTKICITVVTLSAQDNEKLLQQLKSGFKRTIKWKKYRSKVSTERQNQYLDYSRFQGVNIVRSFEKENDRTAHTGYYLPKVEIKNCNFEIDGRKNR